ncbi:MAG: hypothetical protein FXF54_01410 [Kosmotoga sp.]|jgi:hypothetical protein|nr:MAG: hypothetical protein FXF54_01410 [Kosmotoga sp.]
MRQILIVFLCVFVATFAFSETVEIPVEISKTTNVSVPIAVSMNEILTLVGLDFDANWDSLRVVDTNGEEIPFQIDDIDLNGKLSSGDLLITLVNGPSKITISDDFSIEKPEYNTSVIVKEEEGLKVIETPILNAKVSMNGLIRIEAFGEVEGTIVDEIGIGRVSGWVGSTYYVDGNLGKHEEKTSGDFRILETSIIEPGPVGVTVVTKLQSETFVGLDQHIVTTIFNTGDIRLDNTFVFNNYLDMMKVQSMITRPLTDISDDAVHMLPVFRRLLWADQLNITPLEYWFDRNAIMYVNRLPYIVFPAIDSMKPLWWGATYIFASQESWRSNYSPSLGIGVAEILPEKPVVYADYNKWVDGNTWIYESREFRDGVFKWLPGEFELYESTKDMVSLETADLPNHYVAGDELNFVRFYRLYECSTIGNAISHIVNRTIEIQSIKIGNE